MEESEDPCGKLTRLRAEWTAISGTLDNQIAGIRWQVRRLDSFSIRPDDVQDKAHALESLLSCLETEKLNYWYCILKAERDCASYNVRQALSQRAVVEALPAPPKETQGRNAGTDSKVRSAHRMLKAGEKWQGVKKVCSHETYMRRCKEVTGEDPITRG